MVDDLGWEWFIKKVYQKSGIDLTAYKRPQMERRINSFMRTHQASNYPDFIKLINEDQIIYRKFIDHLTINVSEFFRNKNHWDVLQQQIIPELLHRSSSLKIWSAGCSTGEEPYSLAIMMKEHFSRQSEKIWGTDLDQDALNKAQIGLYQPKAVQSMSPFLVKKYFIEEDGLLRIKDEIKDLVTFQKHDLLENPFPSNFDLILCRNVVIYFTEETKEKLYRKFIKALKPQGILFIGSTEQIFLAGELGLKPIATFFYQKI